MVVGGVRCLTVRRCSDYGWYCLGWFGSFFSHQFLFFPVDYNLGGVHRRPSFLLADLYRDRVGPQLVDE